MTYCLGWQLVEHTFIHTPQSRVLLQKLTGFSPSQEIPRILWNPKVHYRIHKCPSPVPISLEHSSQELPRLLWTTIIHYRLYKNRPSAHINPVPTSTPYLLIHVNILLPTMQSGSMSSVPSKILCLFLLSLCLCLCLSCMLRAPCHLVFLDSSSQ
jgi:hypothetical protein